MKRLLYLLLLLWIPALSGTSAPPAQTKAQALVLDISGPIGPATQDYVIRGLESAADRQAALVILQLDTPGGLDTAMRAIIQAILASPVPVASYVTPQGARAASAGTYILYASHVAAMAPATNLGAATPVPVGGVAPTEPAPAADEKKEADTPESGSAMQHKIVNDAVAYIRGLATLRNRNADWAEQAVREAASLPAGDALEKNVIDVVADDLANLLHQIDGRTVTTVTGEQTLQTATLRIEYLEPDWRTELLSIITNPTVAYLLMLIGIYGLIFEGYSPGAVLPGVVGAICLLLALYAFQVLPINYAGLALIALGVILMIAEAFAASFGALGIGGIIAFIIGSVILMDTDIPGYGIPPALIAGMATLGGALVLGIASLALRSRRQRVVSGIEALRRATATAIQDFENEGLVRAQGENWQARSHTAIREGQLLHIVRVDGLILEVEPLESPAESDTEEESPHV